MHLRTEYDLYYIQNFSLLLDIKIMLKTLGTVQGGRGAFCPCCRASGCSAHGRLAVIGRGENHHLAPVGAAAE